MAWLLPPHPYIKEFLLNANLIILVSTGSQFITSSFPVYYEFQNDTEFSTFYLPLNPRLALIYINESNAKKCDNHFILLPDPDAINLNKYYFSDGVNQTKFLISNNKSLLQTIVNSTIIK